MESKLVISCRVMQMDQNEPSFSRVEHIHLLTMNRWTDRQTHIAIIVHTCDRTMLLRL